MAVETLRPNAAGDECNINAQAGAGCPDHYQNVDEAMADDSATYVRAYSNDWLRDLYNLDDHSVGSGTVNKITVYARCDLNTSSPQLPSLKICIKSGTGNGDPDTVSEGSEQTLTGSWADYSEEWQNNPATGSAWTWQEIDKLQAGVSIRSPQVSGYMTYVTQVYVEVDYTDITEKTSSDSGSGSDVKTSGSPLASLSKSDSGSAAEGAPAQEATLTGTETGSGIEAILSLLGKLASEAGSGAENSYVAIITCARESCDGGAGADTSSLLAEFEQDEAGSAVESLLSRLLRDGDSGNGNDAQVSLLAVLSRAETGSGAEALLTRLVTAAETALGIDGLLSRKVGLSDSGSGAEASAIYKMLIATDSGSGLEALSGLVVLIPASELGHGLERLGAKIMTSPGAVDTKLPTNIGKVEVPRH